MALSVVATGAPGDHTPVVVLDTSVLLSDPEALFSFPRAEIVLPLTVIEELDEHKTRPDDVGRAARRTARLIEELRLAAGGDLRQALPLPGGGWFRIELNGRRSDALRAAGLDVDRPDNRILATALGQSEAGRSVTLYSGDVNLRIKAASLGLEACEPRAAAGDPDPSGSAGWQELNVSPGLIDRLYAEHVVALEALGGESLPESLGVNHFAVVRAGSQSALVRRRAHDLRLVPTDRSAWELRPRSKEQHFALDLLLDPDVSIVGLTGRAGTGKTILALAAGLEQTFERDGRYDRLMILRPVVPVGRQEVGFLPGSLGEKLGPWMEAVTDTMVALGDRVAHAQAQDILAGWVKSGRLTMDAVTYLRGRSIQRTYVLVDEAQNLEPLTVKTILTRLGAGSKVVLVGDLSQIDAPYLSERTNALAVLAERFQGRDIFGHLRLHRGERSAVADLAAELL
jgi:PhoH-like ATPase